MRDTHGPGWPKEEQAQRDIKVGGDCMYRTSHANWWEWKHGSTLFFWRWPEAV
jgi:hypothetical protein